MNEILIKTLAVIAVILPVFIVTLSVQWDEKISAKENLYYTCKSMLNIAFGGCVSVIILSSIAIPLLWGISQFIPN